MRDGIQKAATASYMQPNSQPAVHSQHKKNSDNSEEEEEEDMRMLGRERGRKNEVENTSFQTAAAAAQG